MQRVLAGLRAYQEAERAPARAARPAVAEFRGARLRDYGGTGSAVMFVPSLINPPNILDLSDEKSLLIWLADQGHHVFLLDWGSDSLDRRELSVAGHVEQIIAPMMRELGEPPALAGYCLGGTMAIAAATMAPARCVATIAAPWHFGGFGEEARGTLRALWTASEPIARSLGLLPMEVLQCLFWKLDPARTVAKFEAFADLTPASPEARDFVTLEDWANDGPPLPETAAREMFESFFDKDDPGERRWEVAGAIVDPTLLPCPQLHMVSTSDRIVPHPTAFRTGRRIDLEQGHVGMVVGRRATELLWEPLSSWLQEARA